MIGATSQARHADRSPAPEIVRVALALVLALASAAIGIAIAVAVNDARLTDASFPYPPTEVVAVLTLPLVCLLIVIRPRQPNRSGSTFVGAAVIALLPIVATAVRVPSVLAPGFILLGMPAFVSLAARTALSGGDSARARALGLIALHWFLWPAAVVLTLSLALVNGWNSCADLCIGQGIAAAVTPVYTIPALLGACLTGSALWWLPRHDATAAT